MRTILFIKPYSPTSNLVHYQLTRGNLHKAPPGKIYIARFDTSFWIEKGMGYYGNVYMNDFVRRCKHKLYLKRRKINIKNMYVMKNVLNLDILKYITEFI
jgi:hypothetical protein